MRLTHPVSVTPAANSNTVKNRVMGQEFAVFFFKRELDEFLKVIDEEYEVVAAQYEKLVAYVKSGFDGAVKLTRELVTAFRSHIDERCDEEEPETLRFVTESYVSQQQWLECLKGDLGRFRFIVDPRSLKKVNVRIRDRVDPEVSESRVSSISEYRINTTTKFRKVFKQHCTRKSLRRGAVSFFHNGELIDPNKSPVELNMEDGNITIEQRFIMHREPWSAKKLIKVLERKYKFTFNDQEEIEEWDEGLFETLGEDALVFNYEGDFITECDDEEEGVEKIYQFIRKEAGWSLDESPLDMNAWVLYPTKSIKYPLQSLL
tara:strand:+ start:602 stop:1555 length:954 start_codon:yes stop_codon:yes gene_type:complete